MQFISAWQWEYLFFPYMTEKIRLSVFLYFKAAGVSAFGRKNYLTVLLKMIGVTYLAQFSSGICKDAGYSSIAGQIEIFAKLYIMVLSIPVLLALMEAIHSFLA